MAAATIDRRLYSPISDSGDTGEAPPVLMAVSMSVPSPDIADMVVGSAIGREKRVFELHRSFS